MQRRNCSVFSSVLSWSRPPCARTGRLFASGYFSIKNKRRHYGCQVRRLFTCYTIEAITHDVLFMTGMHFRWYWNDPDCKIHNAASFSETSELFKLCPVIKTSSFLWAFRLCEISKHGLNKKRSAFWSRNGQGAFPQGFRSALSILWRLPKSATHL